MERTNRAYYKDTVSSILYVNCNRWSLQKERRDRRVERWRDRKYWEREWAGVSICCRCEGRIESVWETTFCPDFSDGAGLISALEVIIPTCSHRSYIHNVPYILLQYCRYHWNILYAIYFLSIFWRGIFLWFFNFYILLHWISLCWKMLVLNPGLSRLWRWQSDALNTRLWNVAHLFLQQSAQFYLHEMSSYCVI